MRNTSQDLAKWVAGWKSAETDLLEFSRKELRATDTHRSMLALADAFEAALPFRGSSLTTGLVEQQRYFKLMKLK